jgi:membrane protein YdbS with pleckstrin-like domain
MGFDTKLLNDHESIAADLRPHPWYFFKSVGALVLSIIFGIFVLTVTDGGSWTRNTLGIIAVIAIIGCAIWVFQRYVGWISTNFVVTSDRVIYRSGIFAKSGVEIPLERINTVHFNQRLFERMLGTGDLEMESGATDGQQRFTDIRDPDMVQRLIHNQMELKAQRRRGNAPSMLGGQQPAPASGSDFAPPPPAAGTDVATQLEKLEGMLERGTLTPEEFAAQKRRLLGS